MRSTDRVLRRLPPRVAIAALLGALGAGALALAVVVLLGLWTPRIPFDRASGSLLAAGVAAIVGSALAAWLWSRSATNAAAEAIAASEQLLNQRAQRSMIELSQRNAYAAVGDFATELARELAPSVATARTAMRSIERALHPDSPMHAPLERAQREMHRAANTLQDTLRLARSGKLTTRRIDLWVPLRNALRTAAPDGHARGVWVEPPQFGREPIWINGDEDALEQLFLNLLVNAVQETESGGRVTATVALGEDAVVSIADTGRGIPEGALDRVMEPFFSTKADGAGLGLAIAWRTAAAHGGRLSIESALGRGTKVDVALPRADSAQELLLE
jgi:signal transduction histidine kinase